MDSGAAPSATRGRARVALFSTRLHNAGIRHKVVVFPENRPEWIVAFWGCAQRYGRANRLSRVPGLPRARQRHRAACDQDSGQTTGPEPDRFPRLSCKTFPGLMAQRAMRIATLFEGSRHETDRSSGATTAAIIHFRRHGRAASSSRIATCCQHQPIEGEVETEVGPPVFPCGSSPFLSHMFDGRWRRSFRQCSRASSSSCAATTRRHRRAGETAACRARLVPKIWMSCTRRG